MSNNDGKKEFQMRDSIRIQEGELDFDEDLALYEGRPFTGIAECSNANESLLRQAYYRDGFEEGTCRDWYPNGQIKLEWFAVRGTIHGKSTEWHDNGAPKSVASYIHGVEISYEEWSPSGD